MRLNCEVEIVYCLALGVGGNSSRSSRSRASLCLGKKPAPRFPGTKPDSSSTENQKEELYLIVSTAKNVEGFKYKVMAPHSLLFYFYFRLWNVQVKNNISRIFSKFVQEGKATVKFKEPAHDLAISKVINYVCVPILLL